MSTSSKLYGYLPLKGDGKNVEAALLKIRMHEVKPQEYENAIRTARYLDFMESKRETS